MLHKQDPPLTPDEIREWVMSLGKTNHERIGLIKYLLRNRTGDKMSNDDIIICRKELRKLEEKVGQTSANPAPRKQIRKHVARKAYRSTPPTQSRRSV